MAAFVPVAAVDDSEFKPVAEAEFTPVAEADAPTENLQGFLEQPPAVATIGSPVTPVTPQTSTAPTVEPLPGTEEEMLSTQAEGKPTLPVGGTVNATLPRFGKEGTLARSFSDVLSGVGEWAMNKPEEALATLTPLGPAIAARYAPEMAQQWGENLLAGLKGNRKALNDAIALATVVGLPIGAKKAFDTWRVSGPSRVQPKAPKEVALEATQPPPLLPQTKAELSTLGERTTDALPLRKAETLPLEEPPGNRPQVGAQVREQAQATQAQEAVALPTKPAAESEVPRAGAPIEEPKAAGPGPNMESAILEAISEGGMVQGLKKGGDKSGHYVVVPPEGPGDSWFAVGPFENKNTAADFLESEVGAPGAKVVEYQPSRASKALRPPPSGGEEVPPTAAPIEQLAAGKVEPAAPLPKIPQEVLDAQRELKRAEKRWRRAMRQEPSDVEDATDARLEAEGVFRDKAAAAGVSQEQFDLLLSDAKRTETEATAGFDEPAAISQGPGAASPGDVPKGSQLSQLTEAVKSAAPVKRAAGEAVRAELAAVKEQTGSMAANALDNLRALGRAALDKLNGAVEWTNFRDTLGKFSGAINRNDYELLRFTSAIRKHVPDPMRRQAIVNWLQADGDAATLAARAAASKGTLKRGYELATKLTPDEQAVAANVRSYLDSKLAEGIDAGLLKAGIENYVTQLWKRPNPITNKLMGEAASGKLHTDFKYARRRIFDSYFEGEQAGYTPRVKDIGALVAAYDQAFSRAIASRNFVKSLHDGVASDGRPLVEISGFASDLSDKGGNALLVKPRARPEDLQGYRPIDHPAMRGWKWAGTDANGNPILYQGDMLAHPEIYAHLRNALGTSALRRNAFMSTLMKGQAFLKQSKLSLSGFHFTQEAAHGVAHRINPLAPKKIDFADPNQAALADHGLQVADYHAYSAFAEGLSGAGGLYEKFPVIGKWLTRYNEYLFQEYIPRLKMTMALDALERNRSRYGKKLSDDQILDLTARQANAAFGEQNYMMLGRNPTFQDFLRLAFLAPDFLEARARFVSQAFTRYGAEQRIALALQAATLYVGARLLNTAISGDPHWNPKDSFEIFAGKRRYGIRTVVEDAMHAVTDPALFISARLSSTVRIAQEFASGRDWRGIKRTTLEQFADIARWLVPITLDQPAAHTRTDSALAASGVTVRSATAQQKIYQILRDFREKNNLIAPADKAGLSSPSEYTALRNALLEGNEKDARDAYAELLHPSAGVKPKTPQQVREHFSRATTAPFSGSTAVEARFRASLDAKGRATYQEARRERQQELSRLLQWQHRWR